MTDTLTVEDLDRIEGKMPKFDGYELYLSVPITNVEARKLIAAAREGVERRQELVQEVAARNGFEIIPSPPEQEQPDRSVEELAGLLEWMGSHANTPEARECDERIHNEAAALLRKLADDEKQWREFATAKVLKIDALMDQIRKQQERIEELKCQVTVLEAAEAHQIGMRVTDETGKDLRSQLLSSQEREALILRIIDDPNLRTIGEMRSAIKRATLNPQAEEEKVVRL